MERLPYIAVLIAYSLITLIHLIPGQMEKVAARARLVAVAGVLCHLATLIAAALLQSHAPGLPEGLSALGLGVMLAYVYISEGRKRAIGTFLAPLAVVAVGTSLVVPSRPVAAVADTGFSMWLPVHLGLVFSGLGGFALSGAVGVAYLWVRKQLKAKRFDIIGRMPSLEVLDRIQFRSMLFGFVFLTLGIGAGGAWAAASLQEAWALDPKVIVTLIIWAWYAVALQTRLTLGRRGRWTAIFSIAGFAGLVTSLVLVNLLISEWHGYAS